jgi:TfoX/Sxy family transcriptional regulator of competence genes
MQMASDRNYLDYVLQQLSGLDEITYRPMMKEFIIYYQGIVVGGIYDNRFLLKYTKSVKKLFPDAVLETPYDGARKMLAADTDDKDMLERIIKTIKDDLLPNKKRKSVE